jgi:hypothetical protein
MRFDLHLRREVSQQLDGLTAQMAKWEAQPSVDDDERERIRQAITFFEHTTTREDLVLAGVDGSGDYPALNYADSFVYLSTAQATTYVSDPTCGLRESEPQSPPLVDFVWLPESEDLRRTNQDAAFARLTGRTLESVVEQSDYRELKKHITGQDRSIAEVVEALIRPHASDSSNLAIQLRSTAELAAALKQLESLPKSAYLLVDGTFSLPFVGRVNESLFYEHIKRLCCVVARKRGVRFLAISKSHGLPGIEILESLAQEPRGSEGREMAEHWYLRIPTHAHDGWHMTLTGDRRIPPVGAVSYLVRFHKNVPVLRIDMDQAFWAAHIVGADDDETQANECMLFEDLDYASHDQRCFGYPYPIKAAHDRASMTKAERVALRKQVIDAAAKAGMRRSLFRDASRATGHG